MKTCTKCFRELPLEQFDNDNRARSKKSPHCKDCRSTKARELYDSGTVKEQLLDRQRRSRYGLSSGDYLEMVAKANGLCAICGMPETAKDKNGQLKQLAVDHCHTTNKVRGLLCQRCNHGIGMFKDDVKLLQRAMEYLG